MRVNHFFYVYLYEPTGQRFIFHIPVDSGALLSGYSGSRASPTLSATPPTEAASAVSLTADHPL